MTAEYTVEKHMMLVLAQLGRGETYRSLGGLEITAQKRWLRPVRYVVTIDGQPAGNGLDAVRAALERDVVALERASWVTPAALEAARKERERKLAAQWAEAKRKG